MQLQGYLNSLTSTEIIRLIIIIIRDRQRWGKRKTIHLSLHHQNDSCITMGSDESHFIVSINCVGQSRNFKTVSTKHNLFEEKGVPPEAESSRKLGPNSAYQQLGKLVKRCLPDAPGSVSV